MNGKELKAHMIRFGDTNSTLADALGIAGSTFSLKKNGKADFTANEIRLIAERYALTSDEICATFFSA